VNGVEPTLDATQASHHHPVGLLMQVDLSINGTLSFTVHTCLPLFYTVRVRTIHGPINEVHDVLFGRFNPAHAITWRLHATAYNWSKRSLCLVHGPVRPRKIRHKIKYPIADIPQDTKREVLKATSEGSEQPERNARVGPWTPPPFMYAPRQFFVFALCLQDFRSCSCFSAAANSLGAPKIIAVDVEAVHLLF
jgi:hypothetical protein